MRRLRLKIPAAWFAALAAALVFLASFFICGRCMAAGIELSAGEAIVLGQAPAADFSVLWPSGIRPGDSWKASATIVGASAWNGERGAMNEIVRGVYLTSFGRLQAGVGIAYMTETLPYNGTRANFDLEASYRPIFAPIVLSFIHMSNAGIRFPNYGRNLLLIGYRF